MNQEEYLERMKGAHQFTRLGLNPIWVPGSGDIAGFIYDEVVRQYHDPRIHSDGGKRVEWMTSAWAYAEADAAYGLPTYLSVVSVGALVEPFENYSGPRTSEVYIGDSMGAPWRIVPALLGELCHSRRARQVDAVDWKLRGPHPDDYRDDWTNFSQLADGIRTVTDWYAAFEAIHPFSDGNGRTGKILSNWLGGTLADPVLVPNLFKGTNP